MVLYVGAALLAGLDGLQRPSLAALTPRLYAAPSLGATLAALTSGWTARAYRHGVAVLLAAAGWGLGIVLCGIAKSAALACIGLVIAGFADMLSGIFPSTIWDQTIPDRLRGRLAGIEQISYSTGLSLGNVEAGVVASLAGVETSIVSGGILCVATVPAVALLPPAFWRYDARAQTVANEARTRRRPSTTRRDHTRAEACEDSPPHQGAEEVSSGTGEADWIQPLAGLPSQRRLCRSTRVRLPSAGRSDTRPASAAHNV